MALKQIDLSISLTAQEVQAWNLIKPKLKTYMTKITKIYMAATPRQRQWLRAHNAVLDSVLDMLGY